MGEDPPFIVAVYATFLLIGGLVALLHCMHRRLFILRNTPVPVWRISPSDFGAFVGALILVFLLVQLTLASILPETDARNGLPPHLMLVAGALSQLTFLAVWAFFRLNFPERFRERFSSFHLSWRRATVFAVYAFFAFIPVFMAINIAWTVTLETILPEALKPQEMVAILLETHSLPLLLGLFVLLVILAPVAEELIFRGCLYRFLKGTLPVSAAVLISSLLFGAIHLHLAGLPVLVAFGALLCLVYERTGSLKTPILLHAFFNLNTFVITALQSGNQ